MKIGSVSLGDGAPLVLIGGLNVLEDLDSALSSAQRMISPGVCGTFWSVFWQNSQMAAGMLAGNSALRNATRATWVSGSHRVPSERSESHST